MEFRNTPAKRWKVNIHATQQLLMNQIHIKIRFLRSVTERWTLTAVGIRIRIVVTFPLRLKLKHDALQPPLAARRWGTGRTVLTAHAGSCCGGVEHPSSSALSSTLPHSQKFCRRSLNLISFSTTHKTFYQMSADSAASISHKHFSEQTPPQKTLFFSTSPSSCSPILHRYARKKTVQD